MNKNIIAATLATAITASFSVQTHAVDLSQHLSTVEAPTAIKRVPPKYPVKAARQGREGWARLSFVIDELGNVSDVLVTETSGSQDFAKAAKRAILRWKYQPAMENGKPIQQCVNNIQLDFSMDKKNNTQGVSKRFKNQFKRAEQALKDKDYPRVKELLANMNYSNKMHIAENNFMHLLAADYAKEINDQEKELFHLSRAAMSHNDKLKLRVLPRTFNLQINLQQYKSAYSTYHRIAKLEAAKPYLSQFEAILARVDSLINSEQDITVNGQVKEGGYWQRSLVRNEFSLENVDGTLERLDIRCANKRHVYTIEKNNTWTLPTTWKDCSIYVFGKPDTKFSFVEHPLKS